MTTREWIDLMIDRLAGGDCPQELKGKYHPEIIRRHLGIVHNYLIGKVAYPQAVQTKDIGFLDAYTKTFNNVAIQEDAIRDEKYSNLPASIISLPSNRGVHLISPQQGQHKPFLYRDNNTSRIFSNLEVDVAYAEGRFYVEGDKVFYKHIPYGVDKVLMKLIVPFEGLEDDDQVVFPTGYGKIVGDMVFESMRGKFEKHSNDNNSNTDNIGGQR